jgi:hypothetical protein
MKNTMISDNILRWFSGLVTQMINVIPDAPTTVPGSFGSGLAGGTACCATVIIGTVIGLLQAAPGAGGSVSGLMAHSPIFLVVDPYWVGFFFGCLFAVVAAFFILKAIILLWQQVKW